jgi:hypothetical protein
MSEETKQGDVGLFDELYRLQSENSRLNDQLTISEMLNVTLEQRIKELEAERDILQSIVDTEPKKI